MKNEGLEMFGCCWRQFFTKFWAVLEDFMVRFEMKFIAGAPKRLFLFLKYKLDKFCHI